MGIVQSFKPEPLGLLVTSRRSRDGFTVTIESLKCEAEVDGGRSVNNVNVVP